MIIRDATEADVGSCNEVWLSTQPEIGGAALPDQPLARHELRTGRLIVAELDDAVVGFGATLTRSSVLYLADLFVAPQHQGRGIGRQVLRALCADHDGPLFTFSSADPRARWLYEQFGMRALEPYHYLDARFHALTPWATDVELVVADRAEIIALDAVATGRNRSADIDYASSIGATWYVGHRRHTPVGAVAIVSPTWWSPWHPHGVRIGPTMAPAAADISPILGAAVSEARSASPTTDVVSTFVPASLPALAVMLHAGFEVVDSDLLMTSDEAIIDRHRYLPSVDAP